jgi:hypothetical protein
MTYLLVENPIRHGSFRATKAIALSVAMACIGALGLEVVRQNGVPSRLPETIQRLASAGVDTVQMWRSHSCFMEPNDQPLAFERDCVETGKRPLVFLWGDSHAAAFYPGLKHLLREHGFAIGQYQTAGCPPLLGFSIANIPGCVPNNDFVRDRIAQSLPDIVILYSSWTYGKSAEIIERLRDTISQLYKLKVPRIVVLGAPPVWRGALTQVIIDYYWRHHEIIPRQTDFQLNPSLRPTFLDEFEAKAISLGVPYVSVWNALCNDGKCTTRVGSDDDGSLVAFDPAHLTVPGSIYLADRIAPCIFGSEGTLPGFCRAPPTSRPMAN